MGNSEVGHNAIGAGRVFDQGARLVNRALKTGSIFQSAVWDNIVKRSAKWRDNPFYRAVIGRECPFTY